MRAKSCFIRGSVQKFNLVLSMIRGNRALDAQKKLLFCRLRPAFFIKKVLDAAVASAGEVEKDSLYINQALIGRGAYMKRLDIKGRGKYGRITKSFVLIDILLKKNGA